MQKKKKKKYSKTPVLEVVKLQGVVFRELNTIMRSYKTLMHLKRGEVVWFLCENQPSTCLSITTKQVVAQVVFSSVLLLGAPPKTLVLRRV